MLVPVSMNPVTGTFADARVESAFAAMLFRLAFPMHVLLMAIQLALWTWNANAIPSFSLSYFVTFQLTASLALLGRVLIHMVHDKMRAQRMGSWTWTALMVAGCSGDMMQQSETGPEDCLQTSWFVMPLAALAGTLTNGSQGLGFTTKFSLISFYLVDEFATMMTCNEGVEGSLSMRSAIGVIVLSSVCAHLAELQLRRSYAESHRLAEERNQVDEDKQQLEERMEQLQAEKERLLYDVQRRGHPLDDDNRSAICRGLRARAASDSGQSEPELAGSSQPHYPTTSARAPSESLPASLPGASLPPGAPSSTDSESIAPPLTWEEADRQHYAEIAAQRAARLMAEQQAPHLRCWVETGRQWIAKNVGLKRGRAALIAPTRLAPGASPGLERVELAELVELAEMEREEAMHFLVVRHLMPAQASAMAEARAVAVAQQSVISHTPAAASSPAGPSHAAPPPVLPSPAAPSTAAFPCSSIFRREMHLLQHLPAAPAHSTPPSVLKNKFATLVMCDYTPRNPDELPTSRWVSYQRLFHLFQPHAPTDVWLMGPGNLKQLIIEWHKTHPAFAGVEVSVWCKRLPQDNSVVYKFCFEYTPKCQVSIPFGL